MLFHIPVLYFFLFFFFNDTATTEIYTLSLHDALPISRASFRFGDAGLDLFLDLALDRRAGRPEGLDRKSTRLNSSHGYISYAVFCLKKKKPKRHKQSALPRDTIYPLVCTFIIAASHLY